MYNKQYIYRSYILQCHGSQGYPVFHSLVDSKKILLSVEYRY